MIKRQEAREEFLAGVRAELPILLGVIPFGLIYGISALAAGIPASAAQAMSFIVFAGSAQFVMAQLVGAGVPALLIFVTVVVVNLRHVLYSASIAPYTQPLPRRWKSVLAYLLTDEAYAVSILHYQKQGSHACQHWFVLGAGLALWTTWQVSTAIGILLGASIPPSIPLDFALPLTFIALVVPAIRDRASVATALIAGVAVLLTMSLPYKLNLIMAALAGMVAGLLAERLNRRRTMDDGRQLTAEERRA